MFSKDDNLDEALLQRPLQLAVGRNKHDKRWRNEQPMTVRELINSDTYMPDFPVAEKDGLCILQGSIVGTGERKKTTVQKCYILMLDHDTGLTMDEVEQQVREKGLFAILWHTHSHLKPESTIAETKITRFMAERKETQITTEICRAYFRERKVHERILETMEYARRDNVGNGAEIFVRHAPMPRVRSLYVLQTPFDFMERGGTQKAAIEEWNERYAGASTMLGLPFDSSCVDPSRLMYTPRRPEGSDASQFEIRVIAGTTLDLDSVPRVAAHPHRQRQASPRSAVTASPSAPVRPEANAFLRGPDGAPAAEAGEFTTKGLKQFLKQYGHDFEAADFLEQTEPADRRPGGPQNGINFRCPNEDGHSVQSSQDAAFMVTNASPEGAWTMFCHHDSCKLASGGDRAWYLDQACQHYAVDVEALKEFSHTAREVAKAAAEKAAHVEQAQKNSSNDVTLRATAEAMTAETPAGEIDDVLRALAMRGEGDLIASQIIGVIAQKTPHKKTALNQRMKALRKSLLATIREAANGGSDERDEDGGGGRLVHPIPEGDIGEAPIIWMDWPSATRNDAALKRLEYLNRQGAPRIFFSADGECILLKRTYDGMAVAEISADNWHALMVKQLDVRSLRADGSEDSIDPPVGMRIYVSGDVEKNFPFLRNVVRVPIFGPDGTLRTRPGYDPELMTYLLPDTQFIDVNPNPCQEELTTALSWLCEAVRDFPFTDSFDGDDPHDIKLEEVDAEGWALPNPERGKASFANFLAMVLQPFVRPIIGKNPCPFYHIDKASPGTGAGYLVDVATCIFEGARAPISTLARNLDEIQKVITALLRSGATTIFFDNVNHKVDSGELAAMATSGVWRGRTLGLSEAPGLPVESRVIFAGNNLDFSSELMRRNVPIRLDANTPNPAQDRGADAFKHNPLQEWVLANRPMLVWACHTVIQSWVSAGMPKGKGVMNSFDKWATTMSGILEHCGVEGFLSSTQQYLDVRNDDVSSAEDFAQAIYDEFKEERTDARAILDMVRGPDGSIAYDIEIGATDKPHAQLIQMGKVLKKMMSRTYRIATDPPSVNPFSPGGGMEEVEGRSNYRTMKLLRQKTSGHVYWKFSVLQSKRGG